ncbi:MAG: hypothetical protein U0792_02905 [Gemmataceae bacterium]
MAKMTTTPNLPPLISRKRLRRVGLALALLSLLGVFVGWRWVREVPEPDDDGPAQPDGALVLGSTGFNFKGSIDGWAVFDGGNKYLVANGRRLRIIDAKTNQVLRSWVADKSYISGFAVTPDGKRIATSSGVVRLWDGENGKLLKEFAPHIGNAGRALSISPDGKFIASVGTEMKHLRPGRREDLPAFA